MLGTSSFVEDDILEKGRWPLQPKKNHMGPCPGEKQTRGNTFSFSESAFWFQCILYDIIKVNSIMSSKVKVRLHQFWITLDRLFFDASYEMRPQVAIVGENNKHGWDLPEQRQNVSCLSTFCPSFRKVLNKDNGKRYQGNVMPAKRRLKVMKNQPEM